MFSSQIRSKLNGPGVIWPRGLVTSACIGPRQSWFSSLFVCMFSFLRVSKALLHLLELSNTHLWLSAQIAPENCLLSPNLWALSGAAVSCFSCWFSKSFLGERNTFSVYFLFKKVNLLIKWISKGLGLGNIFRGISSLSKCAWLPTLHSVRAVPLPFALICCTRWPSSAEHPWYAECMEGQGIALFKQMI